jgi:hypothetical protein
MSLENVKQNLLDRCIKQLNAIGAEFAIVINNEKYGTLEIAEAETTTRRTRNANRWSSVAADIKRRLSVMESGDMESFKMPLGESIADFQSHVSNQAGKLFGKGEDHYMTAQTSDKQSIEVIRI